MVVMDTPNGPTDVFVHRESLMTIQHRTVCVCVCVCCVLCVCVLLCEGRQRHMAKEHSDNWQLSSVSPCTLETDRERR